MTNTWHFFWDGVTPFEDASAYISERLHDFYAPLYVGSAGVPWIDWAGIEVHCYNLSTAPPRVPFIVPIPITGVTGTGSIVSPETAVCLSFQGVVLPGTPQARRRGRVYLGGFGNAVFDTGGATSFPIVDPAFVDAILTGAETYLLDTGDEGIQWVVWSPTDSASVPIANGWIDNALDTQRRRGFKATARTVFPT